MFQIEHVDLTESMLNRNSYTPRIVDKRKRRELIAALHKTQLVIGRSFVVMDSEYRPVSVRARVCEFNKENVNSLRRLLTVSERGCTRIVCVPV